MAKVDEMYEPDRSRFNELYFGKRPVIHKGAVINSPCYRKWTPDYLRAAIGGRTVNVKHSKTGLYNISVGELYHNMSMPFGNALDLFTSTGPNNKSYYLQQYSIREYFPELLQDLDTPALNSPADLLSALNFWIGGAGCVTQLHYDRDHNFLVQVRGRKALTLFAPEDSGYLYPNTDSEYAHVSRIELENADKNKFPLFDQATPFYCLLEEGDALYLPPYWWHQVRSLEMCINVNYWWNRFDVGEGMGLELLTTEQLCYQIKAFVDKGFDIDQKDERGEPLLIKAIVNGYANAVEAFLILGADPNVKSNFYRPGAAALRLAEEEGHSEMVKLLMEYGA
jgi:hypothetical protein